MNNPAADTSDNHQGTPRAKISQFNWIAGFRWSDDDAGMNLRGEASSAVANNSNSAAPSVVQAKVGPAKKILVVDDDPISLKILSSQLKSKGYEVVTATEGSQAIGIMRDNRPDLMLVDVCFPPDVGSGGSVRWDGFLLVQWIRRTAGRIPAILISGAGEPEYEQRASALGAAGFFPKPVDADRLFASIDMALGLAPAARAQH